MTPDEAKQLLAINIPENRRLKLGEIDAMADDIRNGKFTLSPNPICISTEGKLIDGQNRLHAIIKAGKPAPLLIMRGVSPDAVIDRGVPRDAGDSLCMRGVISRDMSNKRITAVARRYICIKEGKHCTRVSDSALGEFISKHENALAIANRVATARGDAKGVYRYADKAGVRTAILAAVLSGVPEATLEAFCRVVNTGLPEDDKQYAAIMLRNFLLQAPTTGGEKVMNVCCAYAEMAIRDFVKNTPRTKQYRKLIHVYINGKEETWLRGEQKQ